MDYPIIGTTPMAIPKPPPFEPATGKFTALQPPGVHPYCAMMQVVEEDTHANYVVCRGYDPRVDRSFDYDADDANKPGIPVAKPYGSRVAGAYTIGQVFPAMLPLFGIGQTPGVGEETVGHPTDLDEKVEILYDDNGIVINWMLLDSGTSFQWFELKTELALGGTATAHPLEWNGLTYQADLTVANEFTVYDPLVMFRGWARIAGTRAGAWGLAMLNTANNTWEIVEMQHVAKYINFTLLEDMGETVAGQAWVSVDDYYDGVNPTTVYGGFKVYDPQTLHPNAKNSEKGKARLDDRSDEYHIVEMKSAATRNFAVVQDDWENTKAGAGVGSRVSEAVPVKTCDYDDATSGVGDEFDVQTIPKPSKDTALFTANTSALGQAGASIIEWAYAPNGDKVIVSDIWDDPIGTVKWEAVDTANIRDGWALCDGDNGTVDLSAKFIMCIDEENGAEDGSEDAIGDGTANGDGGYRWHGDTENNHPDHDNHRHAIHVINSDKVDAGTDGSDLALAGNPASHIWTSGVDDLDGEADGSFLEHLGDDNDGVDTDNRPRYYVMAAIQRFE